MFFSNFVLAQGVGINTTNPRTDLHDNGNLQLTKELLVGGSENTGGNVGLEGQILGSSGLGKPAQWKDVKDVLILPIVVAIGDLTNGPSLVGSSDVDGFTTVNFNSSSPTNLLRDIFLTYDNNLREYTIKSAGYYRIYASTETTIVGGDNNTAGIAETRLLKKTSDSTDIISGRTSWHHERTPNTKHVISAIDFFNVGDKIILQLRREKAVTSYSGNIQILYTGISEE